jgi:putative inorganic carbon (HCO3(-)) transporter
MTLRSLFILAIMVPGVFIALFNRFFALQLYLWFALFRPQEWLWVDISQLRLSLVLGLILLVPALATGILPNFTHPLSIGALLFVLSSLLAQLGAIDPATGWFWIDYLVRLVVVCLLSVTLITTPRRFIVVLAVIALSFGFHSSKAGLASLLLGGVQFSDGLAGSFIDNNGYALGCAMVMPLLVATGQNLSLLLGGVPERRWFPLPFYLAAGLTAFTVVSLFSRAGFLALGAVVAIFVLLQRRRLVAIGLLCVMALVTFLFVPMPKGYLDRIQTIKTYRDIEEISALSRLHFWRVAVDMARDRPLGVGLSNFEAAYNRYDTSGGKFGPRRAAHSSHFEVLAETGFFGAATYVGLFCYALFIGFRIRTRSRSPGLSPFLSRFFFTSANALIVSMVAFLVGGAFISLALNDLTWLTFALVASLDRLSLKQWADTGTPADQATAVGGQIGTAAGSVGLPESRQAAARSFVWD